MLAGLTKAVKPLRPWSDQNLCHLRSQSKYIQNFGKTNNCLVKVFLKWLDQSYTLSTTHASVNDGPSIGLIRYEAKVHDKYTASL